MEDLILFYCFESLKSKMLFQYSILKVLIMLSTQVVLRVACLLAPRSVLPCQSRMNWHSSDCWENSGRVYCTVILMIFSLSVFTWITLLNLLLLVIVIADICHHTKYYKQVVKVRFQVLTVAGMKIWAFWDIAPCSLRVNQHFRGVYCLHHGLHDGASMHLWNVSLL
jgi:hypothetical protein